MQAQHRADLAADLFLVVGREEERHHRAGGTGRRLVLGNADVRIGYVLAEEPSPLYRNAIGDECVYVESGTATLETVFGTLEVGAIHGRLLTAWAAAGVLGPVLVNYLREYQLSIGVERAAAYDITLYILAGLLVLILLYVYKMRLLEKAFERYQARGSDDILFEKFCHDQADWLDNNHILYALQDEEHDRKAGLQSLPARWGTRTALAVSAALRASCASR